MRSRYEIVIATAMLFSAELIGYVAHADQAAVDEGVDFAQSLVGGVQNLTSTTGADSVSGYSNTNLPQDYYSNQDLSGMQTDAVANMGSASEAAQYGYDASFQPKLQFGGSDPILLNSATVATDTMLNPEVLTVTTGDCTVAEVSEADRQIETCTAWMQPTHHTCNRNLNVDVTWEDISSCTVGATFAQASASTGDIRDNVYARAYCNAASDITVELDVYASGSSGSCTGWQRFTVSDNQPNVVFTGHTPQPHWGGGCVNAPAFVNGGCTGNNCAYTVTFRQMGSWSNNDSFDECSGSTENLAALGYTLGMNTSVFDPSYGLHCVYKKASVNISFERPSIVRTPTVNSNWVNGCGFLEAQVQ